MATSRAALLVTALALLTVACSDDAEPAATCGETEVLMETTLNHVLPGPDVTGSYQWSPPTSGTHLSAPPPAVGVHKAPIAPIEQVTGLEVGLVVVQYDDTVDEDDVVALEALVDAHPKLMVAPAAAAIDGGDAVAATAWGVRLRCDGAAIEALDAFVGEHAGATDDHG